MSESTEAVTTKVVRCVGGPMRGRRFVVPRDAKSLALTGVVIARSVTSEEWCGIEDMAVLHEIGEIASMDSECTHTISYDIKGQRAIYRDDLV